jgi:hypothetical protein
MRDPSTFDYINLGIAVGALLLALVALAWHAAVFLLSGPRVGVAMKIGFLSTAGTVVSWAPGKGSDENIPELRKHGFDYPVVTAELRNKGRMPVSVTRVEVVYSNGIALTGLEPVVGEGLPFRLEAHSEFTYVLPGEEVARGVQATVGIGGSDRVRLRVSLGNGKTLRTRAARLA